ncbi:gp436 family protein [Thaumasiovibrio subtropicus]|uniref:gp436 family protein n=1 Tax=Thaumasiovibrio subtropicus TaxID=1891207 RepID=UPI000B34D3BD|nr:phage protein Gp36 family protein [Thaumasiovibrio subtropicus]
MTYCNALDMIERYGTEELAQLTNQGVNHDDTAIDTQTLDRAIDDACATIDGYIGGRYRLPLPTLPRILTRFACDLARYYLYDDVLDEAHQAHKRHQEAISYLKSVSKGLVQLGFDDNHTKADTNNSATITSSGSVFARDQSKGFI